MMTFCAEPWFFGLVAGGISIGSSLVGALVGALTEARKQDRRRAEVVAVMAADYHALEGRLMYVRAEVDRLRRWERKQCAQCLRFAAADHQCKPGKTYEWPAELPDPEKTSKKKAFHLEPTGDLVDGLQVCRTVWYDRTRLRVRGSMRWIWKRRAG